jgi:hypothetical protein
MSPQQVLPSAKVALESETLCDLERRDDTMLDLLAALSGHTKTQTMILGEALPQAPR